MAHADALLAGEVYLDGLSNVLAEPEFAGNEKARQALQVLEERPLLEDLLSRTVLNSTIGGVQVLIGGEGKLERTAPVFDHSLAVRNTRTGNRHTGCAGTHAHVLWEIQFRSYDSSRTCLVTWYPRCLHHNLDEQTRG